MSMYCLQEFLEKNKLEFSYACLTHRVYQNSRKRLEISNTTGEALLIDKISKETFSFNISKITVEV